MTEEIKDVEETQVKSKKQIYDENKAAKLALKEKELKKQQKAEEKANRGYKNPINNLGGKILIVVLSLAMVAGIIFSLIFAIINAF